MHPSMHQFQRRRPSPQPHRFRQWQLHVAVWQYRSGVFLRQLLLGISNNAQGQAMSCHRVIMSQGGYGEDFEPTTDHYEVMFENANASTNDFDLTLFQGQIYWYPAL